MQLCVMCFGILQDSIVFVNSIPYEVYWVQLLPQMLLGPMDFWINILDKSDASLDRVVLEEDSSMCYLEQIPRRIFAAVL